MLFWKVRGKYKKALRYKATYNKLKKKVWVKLSEPNYFSFIIRIKTEDV